MKVQKSEVVWFNGEFVPWDQANVHVLSHALHYASSVFEGCAPTPRRAAPAIVCLADHVRRLRRSCQLIAIPLEYTEAQL